MFPVNSVLPRKFHSISHAKYETSKNVSEYSEPP